MSGIYLRQSTASQSRALGPFVDDTDFKTPETALTIANTDIKIVMNGGASANKNSGGGTHRVNGVYGVTFDATDTATVGEMEVSVVVAGALPVFHKFIVLTAATYDITFGSSATGAVPVASIAADAITSTSIAANAITAAKIGAMAIVESKIGSGAIDETKFASGAITAAVIATNAITAAKLAADVTTELQAGLATAADLANINLPDQVMNITGNITGNLTGSVASVTGAVGSVTGAVGSVTGNVGGNVAGSVGSVAAGGITAASIATGAIDADALAADAVTEIADGTLARALAAESYAADGATPTLSQALYMVLQNLAEFSITGTTLTVKKFDGTAAMTFTLDDAATPTSRTRAT